MKTVNLIKLSMLGFVMVMMSFLLTSCQETDNTDKGLDSLATLKVDVTSLSFPATEQTATINITSNRVWEIKSSESWCTFSKVTGSGNSAVTIHVAANTEKTSRTTKITLAAGSKSEIINVTQSGTDAPAADDLEVESTSYTLSPEAQKVNVKVKASADYKIEKGSGDWFDVTKDDSYKDGVVLSVKENKEDVSKEGSFMLIAGKDRVTISVVQEGVASTIKTSVDVINAKSYTEGPLEFDVMATNSYRIEAENSWIRIKSKSTPDDKDKVTYGVELADNLTDGEYRNGIIRITDNITKKSKTITVKQSSRFPKVESSPKNEIIIPTKGRDFYVEVSSNYPGTWTYTIEDWPSWLHGTRAAMLSGDEGIWPINRYNFVVDPNDSGSERDVRIEFRYKFENNGFTSADVFGEGDNVPMPMSGFQVHVLQEFNIIEELP